MLIRRMAVIGATVVALGVTSTVGTASLAAADPDGAGGSSQGAQRGTGDDDAAAPLDEKTDGGKDDGAGAKQGTGDKRDKFKVKPGVTFNHPGRKDSKKYAIIDEIKAAIAHTKKGAKIRIMSWNFASSGITQKLIKAHKRGVSVRFIMARSLAGSSSFRQLTGALKKGDAGRPNGLKSFTRTCSHTCRGGGGSMHAKFMVISQTGSSKKVVMQGSSNFTTTAATNQWNDWFTTVGDDKVYDKYTREFELALKDKPSQLRDFGAGNITGWFAPRKKQPDLVLQMLNKVRCTGARGAGINGRTSIRIASAVWQNDRGKAIGRKVKELQRQGCNIRIVFTMMTQDIRDITAGVPKRHLVYDYNNDGSFDRYLHMKAMAISGNYGGKRDARVVFNGSANWSTLGQISDEQGMIIRRDKVEKQYGSWITSLYNNAPLGYRKLPTGPTKQGNPYAELELELQ